MRTNYGRTDEKKSIKFFFFFFLFHVCASKRRELPYNLCAPTPPTQVRIYIYVHTRVTYRNFFCFFLFCFLFHCHQFFFFYYYFFLFLFSFFTRYHYYFLSPPTRTPPTTRYTARCAPSYPPRVRCKLHIFGSAPSRSIRRRRRSAANVRQLRVEYIYIYT